MQHVHVFYGILFFTVLLGSFFLFILWSLSKLQKQKQESLEQLSLFAEVTAQEKDKARITNQLHEDFGATLSVIKLYIADFTLTHTPEIAHREKVKQYLDDLVSKIRDIAQEYLPYSLQRNNLGDTLQQYVRYINENHHQLITLEMDNALPPVPTHKAVNVYRILQEIVENTLKHAQANELILTITEEEDLIRIKTKDNGVGFDYNDALVQGKGMGLNTMVTRIRLLKGNIAVSSAKGGTMYVVDVPI